jgi:hypothetical protein
MTSNDHDWSEVDNQRIFTGHRAVAKTLTGHDWPQNNVHDKAGLEEVIHHCFKRPVVAQYIRIFPKTWSTSSALRAGLLLDAEKSKAQIVYTIRITRPWALGPGQDQHHLHPRTVKRLDTAGQEVKLQPSPTPTNKLCALRESRQSDYS